VDIYNSLSNSELTFVYWPFFVAVLFVLHDCTILCCVTDPAIFWLDPVPDPTVPDPALDIGSAFRFALT
jgi:hypothetical protein